MAVFLGKLSVVLNTGVRDVAKKVLRRAKTEAGVFKDLEPVDHIELMKLYGEEAGLLNEFADEKMNPGATGAGPLTKTTDGALNATITAVLISINMVEITQEAARGHQDTIMSTHDEVVAVAKTVTVEGKDIEELTSRFIMTIITNDAGLTDTMIKKEARKSIRTARCSHAIASIRFPLDIAAKSHNRDLRSGSEIVPFRNSTLQPTVYVLSYRHTEVIEKKTLKLGVVLIHDTA